MADDWTLAWADALDQLELDVAQAELMLSVNVVDSVGAEQRRWVAPTDLGPLPESLFERAVAVNARQVEAARRIGLALGATRRESDLAHRLSPAGQHAAPMYVDHLM
jgi:hypothetical protein